MKTSLLRRMLWAQAFSLGIPLLIVSAVFLFFGLKGASWHYDSGLKQTSDILLAIVEEESNPEIIHRQIERLRLLDEANTYIDYMKPGEFKARYQIFDHAGKLLYHTPSAPEEPYTNLGPGFHRVTIAGEPYWVLVRENAQGRFRVVMAESLRLRHTLVWRNVMQYPSLFIILFLPIALLTWLFSRRALKPLRNLAISMEVREPGDLSPLNPQFDVKEIRSLVTALNRLLARVSDLLDSQRRFVADAAHELRTPLAVISAQAHALMQEEDPAQREAICENLQRGMERATGLVRQLLAVARLESVKPEMVNRHLDLGVLARDRTSLILPLALAKKQDLGVEGPEHLECRGDGSVIGTAIDNLLENAIRYTPIGGTITLRLGYGKSDVFLEVEDDGPGMSEEFKARAFDRFSRELGTHATGTGLGLAIVYRAVELHQGRVELGMPNQGTGLRIRLELPCAS